MAGAYQKTLFERMGSDRVHAAKLFKLFWWVVVAVDLLVALLLLRPTFTPYD